MSKHLALVVLLVACNGKDATQATDGKARASAASLSISPASPEAAASAEARSAAAEPSAAPAASVGGEAGSLPPEAIAQARRVYVERCASCHGEQGRGDGPGAFAINPKPRDYTNREWQASVSDETLRTAILKGGAAIGKSPLMPANPQLIDKPQVVEALVRMVRRFAGG